MKFKQYAYIFLLFFSFYLLVSTLFPYKNVVGSFGKFLGDSNFLLFGYLSIFIPIFIGGGVYLWYKDSLSQKFALKLLGGIFLYLNLLFFQSLVFEKGLIGNLFVLSLKDLIGFLGTFLFLSLMFFWSLALFIGDKILNLKEFRLFSSNPPPLFDLEIDENKSIKILDEEEKQKRRENTKSVLLNLVEEEMKKSQQKVDYNLNKEDVKIDEEKISLEKEEIDIQENSDKKEIVENENIKEVNSSIENEEIVVDTLKEEKEREVKKEEIENRDLDSKEELVEQIGEVKEEIKSVDEAKVENNFDIEEMFKIESVEDVDKEEQQEIRKVVEEEKNDEDIAQKEENKKEIVVKEENLIKEDVKESNTEESNKIVPKKDELYDTKQLLSVLEMGEEEKKSNWLYPSIDFLKTPPSTHTDINEEEIDEKIKVLIDKLKQFKIEGDIVNYHVGPLVTTFEFKPLPHIKVNKILSLQDDLAMVLKAESIRIQAPIPGKDVVGIEIPNRQREMIYLREIIEKDKFLKSKNPLTIALGKDIFGDPVITDLAILPHLLIAGTTGSGKSVVVNSIITSLLYKNSPDDLKFVLIDPKVLEFSVYEDIPHLLTPVITDSKKAVLALKQIADEMDRRYEFLKKFRVKNIQSFNEKYPEQKMSYIVIVIEELAELMMTGGKDAEIFITRIAQKARAAGIHLIVATQRPSVDVVTGLIKANLPTRIALRVTQKIDSKVILDQFGAENLLGKGDMLFTPPGQTSLMRVHAPFVSEDELLKVTDFLRAQREPDYDNSILNLEDSIVTEDLEEVDELFEEAKEIILRDKKTSVSYLQRRLKIGYNRASNIVEQLERSGFLTPPNERGIREINV